jgi:hypothetical protein
MKWIRSIIILQEGIIHKKGFTLERTNHRTNITANIIYKILFKLIDNGFKTYAAEYIISNFRFWQLFKFNK